ncbi:AzlC family protein [Aureimonas altamirensis]|uniref:AzlC family protein n=1 Tax=Aureimonas altamirensis TaxID=370622 RepID=A0A0B1Q662_9HYPH|nr:AzlC family ABC transporter permease [Aureimonas altamirensis]KHJ54320.1 AzlC family protein [Aureimonas altamirensis]
MVTVPGGDASGAAWFLRGMRGILSVPALILTVSMVGFAGLAREAGIDWLHATFMTFAIWALPAKIIVVGAITAGLSLPAAALAVALSSVRLMPMVVALMPELRAPRSSRWSMLFLSHFVAITCWVFAMEHLHAVPRDRRPLFFAGFAVTLTLINTMVVAIAFNLMGHFPPLVAGALAFLTPVYFLLSLFGSAREASGRYGLFVGMALLPVAHWLAPGFDILIAGIVGGLIAFAIGRMEARHG